MINICNIYTFITEDSHKSRKARGINKNVVDNELIYKDFKNLCSMDHIWYIKQQELKAKIIMQDCIELMKYLYLLIMTKNIYLNMDIVDYHIFINLLVNHRKIISSNVDVLF